MAFELKNVVPWGRTMKEYVKFFALNEADQNKKIIGFGDGPASFNTEMNSLNRKIISLDPIYQFSNDEIKRRINETKDTVLEQLRLNSEDFVWKEINNPEMLAALRLKAMEQFLTDFEAGKVQGRYIYHELPNITPFESQTFDLGLSSHFLILYAQLGLEFHIQSITEMLRVCKEIRIFPLVDLNAQESPVLNAIIQHFEKQYFLNIKEVQYEFQRNGNKMLCIQNK